ncbi:hypothetical protein IAG44_21125 [Streptomyces roseirectus]|uniref:Secreted protein n=1 Tax=Streptomyces roseirectus TaxID=2768066 RepID=A0A7H0IFW7_9ACTN|nr:hypothetical protein [Streptomyces roseirectus]QNP71683.1 hypothetical protein IAG44_21125 [Streptomyces roseirectus]
MNLRLLALGATALCAVALPLTIASAGPAGEEGSVLDEAVRTVVPQGDPSDDRSDGRSNGRSDDRPDDQKPPRERPQDPAHLLGIGLATAARCGPELASPDGVEAQTCVLTQGEDTWARTYYRNATGRALKAVLSLLEPDGRTVRTRCAAGAEDEPTSCETPRERTRGSLADYTAVAEFAHRGDGPLLLRSGSNSAPDAGS